MGCPGLYHEKYHLNQEALMVVIVTLEPPDSGIVILGHLPNGNAAEIEVKGSQKIAVALPYSAREIKIRRLPGLRGYRIQQVQRTIDLAPTA